jgi:hypothetical protein
MSSAAAHFSLRAKTPAVARIVAFSGQNQLFYVDFLGF